MKPLPQLRVRTEFSFRKSYAKLPEVGERLAALGTPAAGIVDPNTWGHVRWEKQANECGFSPLFGFAFPVERDDGKRPMAWALASDTRRFYQWTSAADFTAESLAAAGEFCVRFAGAALDDPETFDYIDINPSSILSQRRALALAKRTRKPLVVTCDNYYPGEDDRWKFLALTDSKKTTPQWILSGDELRSALSCLSDSQWRAACRNTRAVAKRLAGIELAKAPMINFEGDLAKEVERGRRYRVRAGHIPKWTRDYRERLKYELNLIREKRFESYFIVVGDLVRWAKGEMLVGPARGSSAGSLVCYLLRITEVDPLVHGLLFERFIDVNRADLPDIDIDFSDRQRDRVFEYLREKYGEPNVARLGNISTLKPRSAMSEVAKRMGIPIGETFSVRNVLIEYSSGDSRYGKGLEDTLENTAPGRAFQEKFPEADPMRAVEGHAWHTSVHAAGVLVSNEPIVEFCTVRDGVAQLDKPDSEYLNLLKIDALGLRTLGVIEDAACVDAKTLYGLKLDDPAVFDIFNSQRFAGVFQFEGAAQRRVASQIPVTGFQQIDHTTALARPGPLGGGATDTYVARNAGREPTRYHHETMEAYLGDTLGVVLYQEQVMRLVRELGQFSWAETSTIRKAMSARKGVEFFNKQKVQFQKGAAQAGIDADRASIIWDEICNFGAWGMNKSHTVSYSIISYWCAYMKAYHPIEYAAALLRNAKDDEQVLETLRELESEGIPHTAFSPALSREHWAAVDGRIIGGFQNIKGVGPAKAVGLVERRDAGELTEKDDKLIGGAEVKFSDLRPAHTMWGNLYAAPEEHRINGPIKEFAELTDREHACVICLVVRKERRDENEALRKGRRGGKAWRGQSLFLDLFVTDDSVTKPIRLRVNTRGWIGLGERLADNLRDGEDWLLVRGKWLEQFSMMSLTKVKCLNRPEAI